MNYFDEAKRLSRAYQGGALDEQSESEAKRDEAGSERLSAERENYKYKVAGLASYIRLMPASPLRLVLDRVEQCAEFDDDDEDVIDAAITLAQEGYRCHTDRNDPRESA